MKIKDEFLYPKETQNEGDSFARVMEYHKDVAGLGNSNAAFSVLQEFCGDSIPHIDPKADFDGDRLDLFITEKGDVTHPVNQKYIEDALARLDEVDDEDDIEATHVRADRVLCDLLTKLGYGDVVDRWKKLPKWYA